MAATLVVLNTDITAAKGAADFAPALDGDLLATGDVVKSSIAGRAVLTFFDGSVLTVDTGSVVKVTTLNHLENGGIQLVLEQTLGRTWFSVSNLKTPDSKFEIRTPTSTAAVRGTAFETNVTQAPATSTPILPGPMLRITASAGLGFAAVAPTGTVCGSAGNRAEIFGCLVNGGALTIRAPVAGRYVLMVTSSAAAPSATIKVDALRGTTIEATQAFTRASAAGDLLRTAFTYGAATPQTVGASNRPTRYRARAPRWPQAVASVLTDADLTAAVANAAADGAAQGLNVRDLAVTIDAAGVHPRGGVVTPIGTFAGSADVSVGAVNGKLGLHVRNLSGGPLPRALLGPVEQLIDQGATGAAGDLPFAVRQVALRPGCMAIMGSTP